MEIVVAPDPQTAATEAATWICRHMRTAVAKRGEAFVAFSGGSTPALMLAALAKLPVPWEDTTVFQVDERVAPKGDPDRNALLLDVLRARRPTIHLMPVEKGDLVVAAERYAGLLPDRLDIVHLGVGDDGHTASWPPGDPVVDAVGAVALSGVYKGRMRMTLTASAVNAARHRLVLATGKSKAQAIEGWLLDDHRLPIDHVRRADTVVMLDAAAAGRLPSGQPVAAGTRRGAR